MPDGYKVKQDDYVEATERLYLNADRSKVVPEGSADAAFLLATPGKRIPRKEALRLGLVKPTVEEKAKTGAPATKQVTRSPATKSASGSDGTVAEIADRVGTIDSLDELDELAEAETSGKNRQGVHDAIDRRRAELAQSNGDGGEGGAE